METEDELIDDLDEVREVIPFSYAITAYGADYPVDSSSKSSLVDCLCLTGMGNLVPFPLSFFHEVQR